MNRFPTLVTYRSALAMRDEAIGFAYRKVGHRVGCFVGLLCMLAAVYLLVSGAGLLWVGLLLMGGACALGVAFYCARTLDFPHFARLSLEELELMRDEMGLRPDVYLQTHGSVLHGSLDEHRAIKLADGVLAKVMGLLSSKQR